MEVAVTKKDRQAADCDLDTINLESAITKYTTANKINILKRRYAHEYDFVKKRRNILTGREVKEMQ